MLDSISRFFRNQIAAEPTAKAADRMPRLQVATCALLLEVAHADQEFSAAERELITSLVRERFGLAGAAADQLIALAEDERQQSTDLYQFTRLIGKEFDHREKLVILELLWQVVYSDGRLEAHEDALMHKLSNLLELKHREMIALKLKVKTEGPA